MWGRGHSKRLCKSSALCLAAAACPQALVPALQDVPGPGLGLSLLIRRMEP